MISDYKFGEIIINGKTYNHDVEVRSSGEVLDWWREEGHIFALADLARALEQKPGIVILGTGVYGEAQVNKDVEDELKKRNIELIIEKTSQAVEIFNQKVAKNNQLNGEAGQKIIGLFHLTC